MKRFFYSMLLIILFNLSLSAQGTPGLEFRLINNGTSYAVAKGEATDSHVINPSTHNGLPVT